MHQSMLAVSHGLRKDTSPQIEVDQDSVPTHIDLYLLTAAFVPDLFFKKKKQHSTSAALDCQLYVALISFELRPFYGAVSMLVLAGFHIYSL